MRKLFYFDKEKCNFESIKPKGYLPGLGVLLVTFTLGYTMSSTKIIDRVVYGKADTVLLNEEVFSEESLVSLLANCNVKYPYIVFAQAKLESNNFKSKIFKQNHNMFGMRKAHQRITSAQTEKDTYAYYKDWTDCVYDYCMYQNSVMCSVSNENEYFTKLGAKYAEDPMYVIKLKNIIEKNKLKTLFEE